ncbi:ABC transporter ATP-binding protein [Limibacillus halophilus]|uniref:Peptide/nickel transport system ATP-binding protein n=1 Tax=Limibacillus halophilus TaxID=1579333 RepID=A0A839SSC6_9PROT|nr:ABC transporter ATP-binding protein [Limibacillus halophilus]MBB3064246.1 peptide/nickel transport system ATP-binding protein [Limibacillus halophilus]
MTSAPSKEPILRIEKLNVGLPTRQGNLKILDDVSFSIQPGEVLGVVGESGAGKSMTGAAVIGLLPQPARIASGEIWVNGRRIDNLSEQAIRAIRGREVGTIFQDPMTSLDPLFTVEDQLVETIRTHFNVTPAEARKRSVKLLDDVGIPDVEQRIKQYPHQFSGGMRQRVVIALALAANPTLIIADEPTTALDVSVQAQILGVLKRLCRENGTAVMLITHDMGVIAEMADRVAVMYAGRVAEIGKVETLLEAPNHPYTKGLMGSIPLLGARQDRLTQIGGAMPRLGQVRPDSCPFSSRCPVAMDRCSMERPRLEAAGAGLVACWRNDLPTLDSGEAPNRPRKVAQR